MNCAIQLYSVRDFTEKNFENAVRDIAALGYKGVEFAGFFERTADEVLALLSETNLSPYGAHASFDDLIKNFDETVAYHKKIGNSLYIIPYYDLTDKEKINAFVKAVNEVAPQLAENGIALAYHNHAYELLPNKDGSIAFEELYKRTDIKFQLDVFWAYSATKDPCSIIEKIKDRLCSIHLKDGFIGGEGNPLGQGEVPLKEVLLLAEKYNTPVVVESETCNPDGMTEAKICIEYLKSL